MPQAFDNCVRKGGRVRTKRLNEKEHMRICWIGGKSFRGEIKVKEMEKEHVKMGK